MSAHSLSHALIATICSAFICEGCTKLDAPQPEAATHDVQPKKDPNCIQVNAEAPQKEYVYGGATFTQKGAILSRQPPKDIPVDQVVYDTNLRIGHLSDIHHLGSATQKNLRGFLAAFQEKKVDVIVVTGDLASTKDVFESTLKLIAEFNIPSVILPGHLMCISDYHDVMEKVTGRKPATIIDGARLSEVRLGQTSLFPLPGHYDADYLHCAKGCLQNSTDLERLSTALGTSNAQTKVVIAAMPHQQSGQHAVDQTFDGVHIGNPKLTSILKQHQIRFGLYGGVEDAGAQASDFDGRLTIPENTYARHFFLNAGSADATPWQQNNGTKSVGSAAIVTIRGEEAVFEVLRAAP